MKIFCVLLVTYLIVIFCFIVPVYLQSIRSRHYRPLPQKCDGHGRCSPTEEVNQNDSYKSKKNRPTELTWDDWSTRPLSDYDLKKDADKVNVSKSSVRRYVGAGGYGEGYHLKPVVDEDKIGDEKSGSDYDLKPSVVRDDDIKASGRRLSGERSGYGGGGYILKPVLDRENDDLKPSVSRPTGRGSNFRGSGYEPKPPMDIEDDGKLPVRRSGTGEDDYRNGGYKLKPAAERYNDHNPFVSKPAVSGDDDSKPTPDVDSNGDGLKPSISRPGDSGDDFRGEFCKPKPPVDRAHDDDDNVKPIINKPGANGSGYGAGGYKPKPAVDRDGDFKPTVNRPVVGGDGYGGRGYKPEHAVDRDDDIKPDVSRSSREKRGYEETYKLRPGSNRGGGYNSKTDDDEYNIRSVREGGEIYYLDDDRKSNRDNIGGFNKPNDDYYNDYGTRHEIKDDEYVGKPVSLVKGNCICVPHYQCKDGHVVTDGVSSINPRTRFYAVDNYPLNNKFKSHSCGPDHVCCNSSETSTVKQNEHQCGIRKPKGISGRILAPSNAGETNFGEWPWQAAVLTSNGSVNLFECGGVLIDEYHVLTVAHCVYNLNLLKDYRLIVRLGEWDTQATDELLPHEDYKVSNIIIHPEFRNASFWNDIALLRLEVPVLFEPHIDTVCLPQYDEEFSGQNCVVTGWGTDEYRIGTFSDVMKEVALQVIGNDQCEEKLRKTRLGGFFRLHEGFLCAEGENDLSACKGDGGGPLVCYRYLNGKSYALAGIVSWGIGCGDPGVPGVSVKIQKYLDWISKTTGVTLQHYWPKQ